MKRTLKGALAGVVTAAVVGGGIVASAAPSFAASTAPPWEPDSNAASPYANVVFYDASGMAVTSGTNLSNPFAYAVATTPADSGSTKAIISFALPQNGVIPANWNQTTESGNTTFSPSSSLPAATPADVKAFAPTYPVVVSTANISTWLSSHTPDTTAGYANTIEVRLQDTLIQGTTTYWETDIGYNNTASPITVDGTTVPANGWAQLFPFVTPTTTGLTTSATGGSLTQTGSTNITLTATVPAADAGTVQFYDGTTVLGDVTQSAGSAQFTYVPANGSHSYTASFVPGTPPGDPTGNNTNQATIIGGSTSSAQVVNVHPPQIATSTSLSASSTSITAGQSDTLTATVSAADNTSSTAGEAGSVQFFDGGSAFGSPVATTVSGSGTTASPATGTAVLTTTSLPVGSDSMTAVFTPTSNAYGVSPASNAVVITVAAAPVCSNTGSSCSDTQNIQVTVNPGTITITTPYTSANPFVLPAMTLSTDGTFLQTSATFPPTTNTNAQQIVVTSNLSPAYAWTLSVSATALTSGSNTIPSSGLGLTNGALLNSSGSGAYPGTVTFTGIPAHNPSPVDTDTNTGLTSAPQTFAHSTANDGTAVMDGLLTLYAATSTPSGTYNGTITFSVS